MKPSILQRRSKIDAAIRDGSLLRTTFTTRATASTDDRSVSGIGVPYGESIEHWFGTEQFDPGSVDSAGARLLWQHDWAEPIGTVTTGQDRDDGHHIDARVSRVSRGDEALTLVADGVIRGFSIGFEPHEYAVEVRDDGTEVIHWTNVTAREFSLVTFPAYESAAIDTKSRPAGDTTHRKEHPMDPKSTGSAAVADALTRADLDPISERLDDLDRSVKLISNPTDRQSAPVPWASMGEFVRALASGKDERARDYYSRAFAGGTTDDGSEVEDVDGTGFLGTFINFVQERRRVINLFQTGGLPADGMNVEYAQYVDNTLDVQEQAAQGDDLVGPGKVTFTNKSEPIKTAGGWSELSRQAIERSNVPQLDTMWTGLGLKYAKYCEDYVRTRLTTELDTLVTAGGDNVVAMPDANPDAYDWFDAIVDAADVYEDRGFSMSGLLVSPDVFKQMYRLEAQDGRPLLTVFGAGQNVVGEIDLTNADGNIGRVPVKVLRKTTGRAFFYDPVAIKTLEASGAPFRLQDDNIINLSHAFSLYGYISIIAPFPTALLPVTMGTTQPADGE